MITTKYNFKQWLRRTYPDVTATPIYGVPAYILSKPLSDEDNFLYNVQQLKDGRYVVLLGSAQSRKQELKQIMNSEYSQLVQKKDSPAPTTFSSFEQWLRRHNITPLNRTFCSHTTASALFQDESASKEVKTYYMYELPYDGDKDKFKLIPYKIVCDSTVIVVLVKASNSTYKSKKQLFLEKFSLMQPLYEQLISCCAKALAKDELQEGTGTEDWLHARNLCEQYMGIQFETTGVVDIDKMKEAAKDGTLGFWTRDKQNISNKGDTEEETF